MELIKIESKEGIQTVNARDLWKGLESKRDFSNWIKDRLQGFDEGIDFTFNKIVERKVTKIEYFLTIDTAKHIAMLERNEKGKIFRQYFIDVENKTRINAIQLATDLDKQLFIKKAFMLQEELIKNLQAKLIESKEIKPEGYLDQFLDWFCNQNYNIDLLREDVYTRFLIWCESTSFEKLKKTVFYYFMSKSARVLDYFCDNYRIYKIAKKGGE